MNNFIITGIPRSGTSLFCNLMNHIQNVVCFNELTPLYYVNSMRTVFNHLKSELLKGSLMPARVSRKTGKEITDTQSDKHDQAFVDYEVDPQKKLFIGSKINVPYLLQIDKIISYGYKIIFVTRDPVYAIASWNTHEKINERYVMDEDFEKWPRYKNFEFKSKDRIGRQVELYNHFSEIIYDNCMDSIVIDYDHIVQYTKPILEIICKYLEVDFELKSELPELENLNRDSRFANSELDEIRRRLYG